MSIASISSMAPLRRSFEAALPGLALSLFVAMSAYWSSPWTAAATKAALGHEVRIMPTVLALIMGAALHPLTVNLPVRPGLTFAVKRFLRWAIALYGLNVTIVDILSLGWSTPLMVISAMTVTIVSTMAFARLIGSGELFGALAGCACAVCGASAALATSTVLPNYEGKEADTAFVAITVNLLATVAMIAYPTVCSVAGFDNHVTGILLGATIHDVAQVVGAGQAVSEDARNIAVIVKLFRVFMLLPVVLSIGYYFAMRGTAANRAKVPVPVFAIMFLVFVLLNSWAPLPGVMKASLLFASNWGLLVAIAALGLGTAPAAILRVGWRHLLVIVTSTLIIAVVPLGWSLVGL